LVSCLFVARPDYEEAKRFDREHEEKVLAEDPDHTYAAPFNLCESMAGFLERELDLAILAHAYCVVICFYREAFSANTGFFNTCMVLAEILGIIIYLMMLF